MDTLIAYCLLEPVAGFYEDRFDSLADLSFIIQGGACGRMDVAVFLRAPSRYIRVMVPEYGESNVICEEKNDEIFKEINKVGAIIRLSFNNDARQNSNVIAVRYLKNEKHIFQISPEHRDLHALLKPDLFNEARLYCDAVPEGVEIVRLLVDAHDLSIPLQYRYLSLYKILELQLKRGQVWDLDALDRCIQSSGIDAYRPLGVTRTSKRWIHELRDKCAHINNGRGAGVTSLDKETYTVILSAMPLIGRVVTVTLGPYANMFASLLNGTPPRYSVVDTLAGKTLVAEVKANEGGV